MQSAAVFATRVSGLGVALAILGLSAPFVAAVLGLIPLGALAGHILQALLLVLTLGLLGWVVTRRLSISTQANSRMAGAFYSALLCSTASPALLADFLDFFLLPDHVFAGRPIYIKLRTCRT